MRAAIAGFACPLLLCAQTAVATVTSVAPGKYASVVLDSDTGTVLYERNAEFARYPASLTKMMTLYLTFEALKAGRIKLTDRLPVSAHAASREPSHLGVPAGSTLVLEDAIRAMTTLSANDAASVVAEALAKGSEDAFAQMMTTKAHALGMKQTTFRNASGLPESGHVSSALDLAILARALAKDFPDQYHYFSLSSFEYGGKRYPSQNRFLRTYAGADGLKTGYINSSGHNLAASCVRGGRRLIAVVLGGDKASWTREYASRLLDIAYAGIDPRLLLVASAPGEPASDAIAKGTVVAADPATLAAAAAEDAAAIAGTGPTATATGTVVAASSAPATVAATPPSAGTAAPSAAPAAPGANPGQALVAAKAAEAPAKLPSESRSAGTETLLASSQPAKPEAAKAKAPASDTAAKASIPVSPWITPPSASPPAAAPGDAASKATASAPPVAAPAAAKAPSAPTPGAPAPPAQVDATRSVPAGSPTSSATPAPSVPASPATPSVAAPAAPTASARAGSSRAGKWAVQVGLYRDREMAEKRGAEARQKVPGHLGDAPLMVAGVGDGAHVSPRFDGLSEADARQTCTQLQQASLPCVVVPPGRDLVVATN